MTVAFDAFTRNARTGTSDPTTFTHTPVGTPAGVIFVAFNVSSTTDHYVAMSYGGVALDAPVISAAGVSIANKHFNVAFLGSGIPTGAQTASFDWDSATTDDIELLVITVTAATDTEIIDTGSDDQTSANVSVTSAHSGREAMDFGFMNIGLAAVGDAAENANMSIVQELDRGSNCYLCHRQTTAGTGDFVFSYTNASAAHILKIVTVAEVVAAVTGRRTLMGVGA